MAEVCAVCSSAFNEPLILPCLHTFCRSCLEGKVEDEAVTCISCKTTHLVVKGVDQFPVNPLLASGGGAEATETQICETHPKIGVEDAMFCRDCKVAVCPMFACLKNTHGEHDAIPIAEAESSTKEIVQGAIDKVGSTFIASIDQATANVNGRMKMVQSRIDECRTNLTALAEERIAQIQAVLATELKRIDSYEAQCKATCEGRLVELTKHKGVATDSLDFATELLASGGSVVLIALSKIVQSRLEDLSDRPVLTKPVALGHISHDDGDDDDDETPKDPVLEVGKLLGTLSILRIGGSYSMSNVSKEKDGTVQSVSGKRYTMSITSMTTEGLRYTAGEQQVEAVWDGVPAAVDQPPALDVEDNSDGTYSVAYTLPSDGSYTMRVKLNNEEIKDSPFVFAAQSDDWALDPDSCSKGIALEAEGRRVVKTTLGHSSVLGMAGWTAGKHEWRIRLSQKQNCYAGVCLKLPEAMTWRGAKGNSCIWCFSTNGYKYSNVGVEAAVLGDAGSLTDITLDCDNRTLTMKNIDSGKEEVISGLPEGKRFYPWFKLYYLKTFFELQEVEKEKTETVPSPTVVIDSPPPPE